MVHSHILGAQNGSLGARVLFIAEAPGRRGAARTGVPLHGDESGRRFERFLGLAGLSRSAVFVTNATLCNPLDDQGHNRAPTARELAACRPFLEQTLHTVCAPVIVTLGAVALTALDTIHPHGLRLATHVAAPNAWCGRILFPLYHPGRQATLHRTQGQQEDDWRALGQFTLLPTPASL
jgi:uracil-DNA glycosylase family 4